MLKTHQRGSSSSARAEASSGGGKLTGRCPQAWPTKISYRPPAGSASLPWPSARKISGARYSGVPSRVCARPCHTRNGTACGKGTGRTAKARAAGFLGSRLCRQRASVAEVSNASVAVGIDAEVLGLEIAVGHALGMQRLQPERRAPHVEARRLRAERAAALEKQVEVAARQVVEQEAGVRRHAEPAVRSDDERAEAAAGQLDLAQHPLGCAGALWDAGSLSRRHALLVVAGFGQERGLEHERWCRGGFADGAEEDAAVASAREEVERDEGVRDDAVRSGGVAALGAEPPWGRRRTFCFM